MTDAGELQTRLQPYLDSIGLFVDNSGVQLDFTQLNAELDARFAGDAVASNDYFWRNAA